MKSNTEKAVLLIATLSLCLGLGLGQIHKQHKQIKTLKSDSGHSIIHLNLSKELPSIRQHPILEHNKFDHNIHILCF